MSIYYPYKFDHYHYLIVNNTLIDFPDEEIYTIPLNQENSLILNWVVDYSFENLIFEVHIREEVKWLALGFSDRGERFPADYCVLWHDWKGRVHFQVSNLSKFYIIYNKKNNTALYIKFH